MQRQRTNRGGAYRLEINSQADWDNLFNNTWPEWYGSSDEDENGVKTISARYIDNKNPIKIILKSDITLTENTTLAFWSISSGEPKDFLLDGNGYSITTGQYTFTFDRTNTVTINNVHFENETVKVSAPDSSNGIFITNCTFSNCSGPCINSTGAPCPVSFSDCYMNNSGLLFESDSYQCKVKFTGITAENCTGAVLGQTVRGGYYIESISDCKLSTSTSGLTAIEHSHGMVGEITDCTITGFDTGIKLDSFSSGSSGIDTLTISNTSITDCIIGIYTNNLSNYNNAIISELIIEAREGASNTIGYDGHGSLTGKSLSVVNYDFEKMPQIKKCTITGFDTGIQLVSCQPVVSECVIKDCKKGINASSNTFAVVDTELKLESGTSVANSVGVTAKEGLCYLIDCDINGFDTGSDMKNSNNTTIIGCIYENRDTNLIGGSQISVYDTSFIGGETSVILNGTSYFYDCVVEGYDAADTTTKSGFSKESYSSNLYIYSLDRPYDRPYDVYDNLKNYSNRTNDKSEIFNCETGIDYNNSVHIADTHIHDCATGIQAYTTNSHGNNLIEKCTDGMIVDSLYKNATNTTFTDTLVDTICNCSNNGLDGRYITLNPTWKNRLEIYDCGNYGIKVNSTSTSTGSMAPATVEVHDCGIGIYITDNVDTISLESESKIYDNRKWNVYDDSSTSSLYIRCSEGTLTSGEDGNNIYFTNPDINHSVIDTRDLYSDGVYYLGTVDGMCKFNVYNLYGTVVFDTVDDAVDSGYIAGRRVAVLNDPNVASQMFAKKEGFIISTETEELSTGSTATYAVFAEGYDVTYDVTANGGDTFIDEDNDEEIKDGKSKRISYLKGTNVNLNYKASKPGYTFVGWNTDEDATEGLEPDTFKAETADITLYAIYKKTADINYHTYDADLDYSTDVTFYNNEDEIECELAAYNADGDKTFAGYVLNEDTVVSSADDLLKAGDNVTVSSDGLDVYCVYEKQGQLTYLKKDGTTLSTESKTVYEVCSDNKEFVYTVRAGESVEGFIFTGWKDAAGKSYTAGATLSTEDNLIVLTPVYVENAEPTPETPTPEKPTPETPTPEKPTPETPAAGDPVIQPPTTEASTTQAPAGPKTGDSTNPIGVIGLGILSLLGILILTMKNKRKN